MEFLLIFGGMGALAVLALEFSYDSRDEARALRALGTSLLMPGLCEEAARAAELTYTVWRDAMAARGHDERGPAPEVWAGEEVGASRRAA